MEICKNQYESDGLLVRIVDTEKSWKDSVDYCQQFGEQLAPINNWKRLNDTLNQLEDCYKSDVGDVEEFRTNNKYRVGLSIKNRVRTWSDGTLLDVDEQKSLFFKDVAPNKDGNTFHIRRKHFSGIRFDSNYNKYNIDDIKLPFLCSKNKLIPTRTELATTSKYEPTIGRTDNYSAPSTTTSSSLVIGTSLGFVLLLVIIVFLVYKLFKKHQKRSNSLIFMDLHQSSQLAVDDAVLALAAESQQPAEHITVNNITDENYEPIYSEIRNPLEESVNNQSVINNEAGYDTIVPFRIQDRIYYKFRKPVGTSEDHESTSSKSPSTM